MILIDRLAAWWLRRRGKLIPVHKLIPRPEMYTDAQRKAYEEGVDPEYRAAVDACIKRITGDAQ